MQCLGGRDWSGEKWICLERLCWSEGDCVERSSVGLSTMGRCFSIGDASMFSRMRISLGFQGGEVPERERECGFLA